jgi:hypothetical protein
MGHFFVAQGDLTKLACDALLIPCDEKLNVNEVWKPVLPEDAPRVPYSNWLHIDGIRNAHGCVDLPAVGNRKIFAFTCPYQGYENPSEPVDGLWTALRDLVDRIAAESARPRPLIGIPLVGTGDGGLESRRAEVIAKLLERQRSDTLEADLALVLIDPRDFAAVQNQRNPDIDWPELSEPLRRKADELGRLAAKKELSLFLGAGVSRPAGLPDWNQLLGLLAREAGMTVPDGDFEDAATPIKKRLGDRYEPLMQKFLDVDVHAVGHALLAGLRANQMVTTNFDPCMESALEATHKTDFRVLVRELAEGGKPWLLKLHGDIRLPDSLVLDSDDVRRHGAEGAALRGVVQSLLLTSHLLFVGFSFKDKDFMKLAHEVTVVRQTATCGETKPVGTALALTPRDFQGVDYKDLETLAMREAGADEAARTLEIFLDRLGWAATRNHRLASEYLMDKRYASGLSDPDRGLRDLLERLVEDADANTRTSPGWSRVVSCLLELGADRNWLESSQRTVDMQLGIGGSS